MKQPPEQEKNSIPTFNIRTNCFKYSFFPSSLNNWFNLDINIRNSESMSVFKNKLLSFIHPVQTKIYNIFDTRDLTFLTHLRLGLSHLQEHRFRHNVQDGLSPLCSCSLKIQHTSHYLLQCHHFSHHHVVLMNSVKYFVIILILCLKISKKISFYTVTLDLIKTKIKLF